MQAFYSCREPSTTSRTTFASATAAKTCRNRSRNSAPISTPTLDLEIVANRQWEVLHIKIKRGTEKNLSVPPETFSSASPTSDL